MKFPQLPPRLILAAALLPGVVTAQPPAPTPASDETIRLDPFDVKGDSDSSYGAVNSRSITSFDAELSHLPVSADIFDQAFTRDVAQTSVEDTIRTFSAGAGFAALDAGSSASSNQPGDRVALAFMQLRGVMAPTIQRDSMLPVGTFGNPGGTSIGQTNNFDVERIEVIKGPESLLYNGGGPGGVINVVSKRARLGAPTLASFEYRIDQYGSKRGLLDFGASKGNVAVRVAIVDGTNNSRRVNVGDQLKGTYVQFAARLSKTTLRLSLQQTTDWRVDSSYPTVVSNGTDPINGLSASYLIATNQGALLDNGLLGWHNFNSLYGTWTADKVVSEFASLSADTRWSDTFSTQVSAGWSNFMDAFIQNQGSFVFYSPNAGTNPIPGNWTVRMLSAPSSFPASDVVRPYHSLAGRFAGLITTGSGATKSQTSFGFDYVGTRGAILPYAYYQADASGNVVLNGPISNATGGRIALPTLAWSVSNGPVLYPLAMTPGVPRFTDANGVTWVRALTNPMDKSTVSAANPQGTTVFTNPGDIEHNYSVNTGAFLINYTNWFDGKVDTLVGLRAERTFTDTQVAATATPLAVPVLEARANSLNFNAGLDYHLKSWLAPYFQVSDSALLPPVLAQDPVGAVLPASRAIGEEAGFKLDGLNGKVSGSLGFYHLSANNHEYRIVGPLSTAINPPGLNGKYNGGGFAYSADTASRGVELTLTAAPTTNWRMRFSGAYTNGSISTTKTYAQLYNDQFHENSQGQVTYADGTVVYVPAKYTAKQPTVTAGTAGAVPLTVDMLSQPISSYYANPNLTSGAIAASSSAAAVLKTVDPVHGKILTGATGLPISNLQLVAADIPGLTIPGRVDVSRSGNATVGYPEYSFSFTNRYEFAHGPLKRLSVGGTVAGAWHIRQYYYYGRGLTTSGPNAPLTLFSLPPRTRLDLILGYTHKLGRRFVWSTQLNVNNLFNHYNVILYPNSLTGFTKAVGVNANFDQQPRMFVWTNTIRF